MQFLLNFPNLSETNAERRIEAVTQAIGKSEMHAQNNTAMFSAEQIAHIKAQCKEFLYYFGYTNHSSESSNTDFFKYDEHEAEMLERYNKFTTHNNDILQK